MANVATYSKCYEKELNATLAVSHDVDVCLRANKVTMQLFLLLILFLAHTS